jgi:23S rRNA (cytosine1962-C5)-methyltransferase
MTSRVTLLPRRARPFYGRHPWVFAGAIAAVEESTEDGAEVDVFSHANHFVAHGLFNSRSKIRVRLYSWDSTKALDRSFFLERLRQAIHLRDHVLGLMRPEQACRLVFSEGDGLSGCTVDRYDRWLVVQFTGLGLAIRREMLADLLMELVQPEGIYLRTERGIGKTEGIELQDGLLRGQVPDTPITIREHGVLFLVHLAAGQKTGFYLDQRDNRQAVARLANGRRMLDAFCYTGGFGLHAARAGASEVIGMDVSESAIHLARANARLNEMTTTKFVRAEIFEGMAELVRAGERFGLVVLDPPKFARARHALEDALRGYRRLQEMGLQLLEPDGILVTCCCSGLITFDMLEGLLAQTAAELRRDVQILERRGQSADHPISVACPQSNYLKCLVSRVI